MNEDKEFSESNSDAPSDETLNPLEVSEDDFTDEEERTEGFVDAILEGFSVETNVSRMSKITRLPEHIAIYVIAAVYLTLGILCVSITNEITEILPYLVGGMMVLIGVIRFIIALVNHEYRHLKTNQTASSLIVTALGIMVIVQQILPDNNSAITFIAIVWGILGLFEGAHALNHAFKRISNSERCVYFLIRGMLELVVAFMLLYNPQNEEIHHFHIIVFGINLIVDAITMIPKVKEFLTTK